MARFLLAYSLGILFGCLMTEPGALVYYCGLLLALLFALQILLPRCFFAVGSVTGSLWWFMFLLAGLGWHALWADRLLQDRLPSELEGVDIVVEGRVTSLVRHNDISQRFQFLIDSSSHALPGKLVQLGDYEHLAIKPGQRWRFEVRLSRVHGLANPGSFDYEGWLFQQGVSARGYVRAGTHALLVDESISLLRLRYQLRQRLLSVASSLSQLPTILALTLGDRSLISSEQWQSFSATGTNHLFVISGLHIGLVATFSYLLAGLLWRLIAAGPASWPRQKYAALAAIVGALIYSLLAGFTLPTQRALIMILVFMGQSLSQRPVSLLNRYLLALAAVLTLNPLAATNAGFWLSFMAVAALLFSQVSYTRLGAWDNQSSQSSKLWHRLARPQWVIFVALLLPLSFWTGQVSLLAPLLNSIAIPLVGFLVVPLCLFALPLLWHLPELAVFLLSLADQLLSRLFAVLSKLAEVGLLLETAPADTAAIGFSSMALLLWLLPRYFPARHLALVLAVPLLLPFSPQGPVHGFDVHVVDVGQGLATIVRTRNHALLYDTGAFFNEDFDMGSGAVVPVLRSLGIRKLDAVVVSHGDNDHAGGLVSVLAAVPTARVLSSDLGLMAEGSLENCHQAGDWHWDGVDFRFFASAGQAESSRNNRSCVLRVASGESSLLMPGDIERSVERRLALEFGAGLASSLLLAPHHGSASSSSYPFIKSVDPDFVVFSAGYGNSFGHPAQRVVQRYEELAVQTLETAAGGMISFHFDESGGRSGFEEPECYRSQQFRYWQLSGYGESCRYLY